MIQTIKRGEKMEALRQDRLIGPDLDSTIGHNGVRESDEFILDIFQERKKSFKLNRTKYKIMCGPKFEFDFSRAIITLPFFGKHEGSFELELIADSTLRNHSEKSRYLFRSVGERAFRLNGIHCFEAYLERGDVLDIGFNRIHFPRVEIIANTEVQLSERLIKSPIAVLIEGETGTGKTTLARKIHEDSGRRGKFVHLNLSAFSPSLIESELFGHVKGAFTGAINGRKGAILEAHKGTLFLDEIDSLTTDLQTKLLLFLDNYEVRAVGGESSTTADVRMIFASGSKLAKKVERKEMRKDFYYRLQAGCSLTLDSLRVHPERIKELCQHFENQHAVVFDKELINFYMTCKWPGNIRQLQSHLVKKKILSDGKKLIFDEMDKELLLEKISVAKLDSNDIKSLEKVKLDYCHQVYLKLDRNITRTAKTLELCPNTLKAYLQKREGGLGSDKVIHVNF
jgi:transcriptional regulator of acetoin/glycerol metabolism